ncbi:gamma-glutamyltransferase [Egibacter rhizosphaerae]|uniref:Gamma-glutamyltransferase n=1 Tax=Egibacter rhizosphaerae TaxID=1670831 RepID=A0A411YBZ0_9ACTN|nr:gamma-glutamyltransferase [Egibacter rhizosphaerae]QBI18719.1 gamma-glutamyltransferase [Egibacter rhizosphaerae]
MRWLTDSVRVAGVLLLAAAVLAACTPGGREGDAGEPDTAEFEDSAGDDSRPGSHGRGRGESEGPDDAGVDEPDHDFDRPRDADDPDESEGPGEEHEAPLETAAVSAGHPEAAEVGAEILEAGGNAVDAAVAASFAVSVVEPFGSGMGGGGAALVVPMAEEPVAFDYRDVLRDSGEVPTSETGIPGFVAGMQAMADQHGTMDLDELLQPAIALAADGTTVSDMLAERLRSPREGMPVGVLDHLYPGGEPLAAEDDLVQEELARTLERLADGGAAAFYEGELADELAEAVEGVDRDSLAAYEVEQREVPRGRFAGYEVMSGAPPTKGSTMIQQLQVAEALGVADDEPGSADAVHNLAMAWRLSDAFARTDLGDPDFADVPVDELTDADRNARLAEQVDRDALLPVDRSQPHDGLDADPEVDDPEADDSEADDPEADDSEGHEPTDTTHISVIDADGTAVSMTNTLSNMFGSGQYALGFFLNDQMRNFDEPPNDPEPGKRTVASSSPTVVVDDDGRPVLALGTPGGRRIPHVLGQVLVRWGLQGESLEAAVEADRYHLEGRVLQVEQEPAPEVVERLRATGYDGLAQPAFPHYFGSVQALEADHGAGEVTGVVDPRREGAWVPAAP